MSMGDWIALGMLLTTIAQMIVLTLSFTRTVKGIEEHRKQLADDQAGLSQMAKETRHWQQRNGRIQFALAIVALIAFGASTVFRYFIFREK